MDFVSAQEFHEQKAREARAREDQLNIATEGARRAQEAIEHDKREHARVDAWRNRWTPEKQAQEDREKRLNEERVQRIRKERMASIQPGAIKPGKTKVHPWRK